MSIRATPITFGTIPTRKVSYMPEDTSFHNLFSILQFGLPSLMKKAPGVYLFKIAASKRKKKGWYIVRILFSINLIFPV